MNLEQLNQSLKLSLQELVGKLTDEMTAKHLIAIQVVEKDEELARLRQENSELLALLEKETSPREGGSHDGIA